MGEQCRSDSNDHDTDTGAKASHPAPLVLLVEPDADLQRTLRTALHAQGYSVVVAADAQQALESIDRHVPRLIVQDLTLPDMDGMLAAQLLLARLKGPYVPIIGLASRAHDELRAARLGISTVLFKPVETSHLLRVAQAHVGLASQASSYTCRRRSAMKSAQLQVLAKTSEALARDGSVHGVLGECLAACLDIVGIVGDALFLVDRDSDELRLAHHAGFSLERCDPNLLALARRAREAFIIPSGHPLLAELAIDAALLVPLAWAGRVYGVLLVGALGHGLLTAEAIAFAELIATELAQALALDHTLHRLSSSESRYRTIMDHAYDAICVIDERGVIIEANRRFEALLRRDREPILGRDLGDFATPDQAQANLDKLRAALAHGVGRTSDVHLQSAEGTPLVMEFSTAAICIDHRPVLVCVGHDVSEQQRTQAQLMVSDRMASVGMLAAGVAHEINNPLAAVLANLELASKDAAQLTQPTSELVEELSDAREGAERVRQIVRDLKLFSRAEEEKQGAVDIHRVLDSSARMAWNELRHHAQLVKQYGHVPLVIANESRLGQVFLNLIVNAAQAIPEGRADHHRILLSTRAESGRVVIEIADTGSGMPPEVLRRLFTPFFTTKPIGVGTGLGLSICQRIVSGVGGAIEVESQVGKGTTFRVILPAASHPSVAPIPPEPPAVTTAGRGRVLVIDDDALVVRLMHRILTSEHDVTTVASAQEALDLVHAGEWFDVVLCDVMMPKQSGMDLHAILQQNAPHQAERMIFVTGGAFTPGAREFLDRVSNPRVNKPFDAAGLRQLVNERVLTRKNG